MGSSPVTATIPTMDLLSALEAFFRQSAPLEPGDGLLVAFSGGPDSTALLWGLSRLALRWELQLHAAHFDHALDPASAARAAEAAALAARLGVPLIVERRELPWTTSESPEAAGRRARYEFLERIRSALGARWVATAHHRDDQAETVLLRLLFGTGLAGLAGVRPVHGAVVRPLLQLSRSSLAVAVAATGLAPVNDATNRDLAVPRNRVRHQLLPTLADGDPELALRLARLAERARAAGHSLDRRLAACLPVRRVAAGVAVERRAVEGLAAALQPHALAWLHRWAGAPYPAGEAAREELLRQLRECGRAALDCGGGWRWEASGESLLLRRARGAERGTPDFTYTLEIPGELQIPELALRMRVFRGAVQPWMFEGAPGRAGLALPLTEGHHVTVRNRRPGDRIRPLGASGSRRLKEVLIDRRVPREERDRLPLLCVGERIAWAPGVTIDDRFRLHGETTAWIAEVRLT